MDLTFGTPLSQSGRLLQLTTPLGADALQALRAHVVERISHRIVFTDSVDTLPALAPQSVPFHTQSVTEKQDGITQWSTGSQLLSGKLNWRSVDYRSHSQPRESVMLALEA
nr:contractile injection system protein, VgrG/Pvc8 family [Pseudomonas putida]